MEYLVLYKIPLHWFWMRIASGHRWYSQLVPEVQQGVGGVGEGGGHGADCRLRQSTVQLDLPEIPDDQLVEGDEVVEAASVR